MTWDDYLKQSKNYEPRPLLMEALNYVNGTKALDLGAGALNDARFLMSKGFDVLAVDSNSKANTGEVPFVESTFENFSFTEKYNLITAQYALPFTHPDSFSKVMQGISNSLETGGVFTGQFFGPRDEWFGREGMTFNTENEVREFFSEYELLKFEEEEKDKPTAAGPIKHWHVFHVIARKK